MYLPWIGLEVAVLSMLYEYVFVNLHLVDHQQSIPVWTYLAQLVFCHGAYGVDRFMDVMNEETDNQELISYVKQNTRQVQTTIVSSVFMSIICLLQHPYTTPLILPFLCSVIYYRDFKKKFPLLKPLFICSMIVLSSVVVPSILVEHNYNILTDVNTIIPPFANLYSSSNYLDILDEKVDRMNKITTLPVLYGNTTALSVSLFANVVSFLSHIHHPHFHENMVVNSFFQAQNVLSGLSLFHKQPIDFRKSQTRNKTGKMTLSQPYMNRIHLLPCYPRVSFLPRLCV